MMGYQTIVDWYKTINILRYYYHFDDATIMNWLPFERDITLAFIKETEDKKKQDKGIGR